MCKKLLVFMLVLCFASSALAVTTTVYAKWHGSTLREPAKDSYAEGMYPGLDHTSSTFYTGLWTTIHGMFPCTGTGWLAFDVPDLGGQIIEAKLHLNHSSCSGSRDVRMDATRSADDSWTSSTIYANWSVTADTVQTTGPGGGTCQGVADQIVDITDWFGAGKESITGDEMLSVRVLESPLGTLAQNYSDGWTYGAAVRGDLCYLELTIPEPATIALLGLGGLALLRRKR